MEIPDRAGPKSKGSQQIKWQMFSRLLMDTKSMPKVCITCVYSLNYLTIDKKKKKKNIIHMILFLPIR